MIIYLKLLHMMIFVVFGMLLFGMPYRHIIEIFAIVSILIGYIGFLMQKNIWKTIDKELSIKQ